NPRSPPPAVDELCLVSVISARASSSRLFIPPRLAHVRGRHVHQRLIPEGSLAAPNPPAARTGRWLSATYPRLLVLDESSLDRHGSRTRARRATKHLVVFSSA